MDTKTKRAAALGYGLAFLTVLPVADGAISVEDAGHALAAYSWDMPLATPYAVGTLTRTSAFCRLGGTLTATYPFGTITATYPFGTITRS